MYNIIHVIYHALGGKNGSWLQRKWSNYRIKREKKIFLKRQQKLLQKYGLEILDIFFSVCKDYNIQGWLEYGTLLGAYRDKSFIPHDFDLDVGIYGDSYTKDFEESLISRGFKKYSDFFLFDVINQKRTLSEVCFEYKGMTIDVFFSYNKDDHRVVMSYFNPFEFGTESKFICHETHFALIDRLEYYSINGRTYPCPNNPEIPLSQEYGENFMIPDPNFVAYQENKYSINLDRNEYYGIYKKYL